MILDVDIKRAQGDFTLDVTFQAGPGVTVLFGPSGSGKTTILNAVAGLVRPDAGRITFGETPWFKAQTHLPPPLRGVGYVFQEGRLFPHLTVRKNLTYASRFGVQASAATFGDIVQMLDIAPLLDRRPNTLSGGERQRVAIGRALLRAPQLLCLDEPLSALDGPRRAAILPYIERIAATMHIPILYVTHDMAEVTRLADHLVVLDQGRVVAQGSLPDVMARADVAPFLGPRSLGAVLDVVVGDTQDGLTQVGFDGGHLLLPQLPLTKGDRLRLNIPAQDVILATKAPVGLSALNVLRGQVVDLQRGQNSTVVHLSVGPTRLIAQITGASANRMALEVGQDVYAIVKATAVTTV